MAKKEKINSKKTKSFEQLVVEKGKKASKDGLDEKSGYKEKLPWPERLIHKPRLKFKIAKAPKIPVPSRDVIFAIFLVAFAFLIAGVLYDITRNTIPLNYKQEDQTKRIIPVFFWNDLHEQFVIEGVVASIIIMMGAFGVLFIYQSTKNFYRPKSAYSYLALGIALMILSFIIIEYFMGQKGVKLYSADL
ncbi:MAG: hypothetical protein ACTSRG_02780 [Candidatus Helarchaeota archaeon]